VAKGFYIEMEVQDLIRALRKKGEQVEDLVNAEIAATALDIQRIAAQRAPNDLNFLRNSGYAVQETGGQWAVGFSIHYAPYIEFGTGDVVDIPPGLEEYARQFKADPRKKLVNLRPRPFFFPTYYEQTAALKKRLQEELNRL
jgi:hypothetical protein